MKYKLIVIGTSLGGFKALQTLLGKLPAHFPLPLAIVQHRSPGYESLLAQLLQESCALPIEEAEDKTTMQPGKIYLAPAGYHLLAERGYFSLSTEAPVQYSRPSIDVLFDSASASYGSQVVGVILTGANRDGARGGANLKKRGGWLVVQEPATAESKIMPEAALALAPADRVLAVDEIASHLVTLCYE
jgi:two-component system chemotaxis response regulator CheB